MAKFMPYDLLKTNFIQQDAKLNSVAHSGFVSNLPFSPYCPIHFKCLKNILKMEENQPQSLFLKTFREFNNMSRYKIYSNQLHSYMPEMTN